MARFCDIELGAYFKHNGRTYLKISTNDRGLMNAQSASFVNRKTRYFPPNTTVIPVREPIINCELLHTIFVLLMMIGIPIALITLPILFAASRFLP